MKEKILNLLFRGLSILGRFLLIFYIGKYFPIELLGDYGIFVTTITLAVLFVGYDFYVHTTRDLLKIETNQQGNLIFNQLIAHLITYVAFFPFLFLLFYLGYLSYNFIFLFYALVLIEHIGIEIFRILVVLENTILANILLFLRTSLWAFYLIPYWHINEVTDIHLISILYPWLIAGLFSNLIGIIYLLMKYKGQKIILKKEWIKKGYLVGSKFFIGTVAFKIVEFSDRYIVDFVLGREVVGVYTFYSQLSNILNTILFTLVITLLYPKLIKAIYDKDKLLFIKIKRKMFKEILILSGIIVLGAIFFFNPVLTLMGKGTFVEDKGVFYFLLFSTILFNLSYVYHFILLGHHKDNQILYITIAVAIINIILNLVLINLFGLYGAGISKFISFGLILLLNYKYLYKLPQNKFK